MLSAWLLAALCRLLRPCHNTPPAHGTTLLHPGFCPHLRTHFATWHRAQLLSFESVLRKRASELALRYSHRADAAQWCAAADQLALPYFDWASLAAQRSGLPAFFEQLLKAVDAPGGRTTIPNPLKGYTIPRCVVRGASCWPRLQRCCGVLAGAPTLFAGFPLQPAPPPARTLPVQCRPLPPLRLLQ